MTTWYWYALGREVLLYAAAYAARAEVPLLHSSQVIAGVFQSTGWPSVVAIMGNWYGKGKRGLVMGIWNAHTSLGNILGTVVAAACLRYGWGYAFILPGVLISLLGLVVFAVLVVQPSDIGLGGSYEPVKSADLVSVGHDYATAAAARDALQEQLDTTV